MKILGACFMSSGVTILLMLLLFLPFDQGERCETIVAAYDATQQLYEDRLAQQQAIMDYTASRLMVAQQQQGKRSELDEIRALAAHLTPIEAKAKEDAKQNGGWVVPWLKPWLKEQIWKGAAMAYGRGK